jgi:hypothetical protein
LTDQEIKEGFEYAHPRVLAALLDIVVTGLRRREEVQRRRLPLGQMADFTLSGFAVAPAVGWSEDDFRLAYRGTRREAFELVIENDPVAAGILALTYEARKWGDLGGHCDRVVADVAGRGRRTETAGTSAVARGAWPNDQADHIGARLARYQDRKAETSRGHKVRHRRGRARERACQV